jgi:hypothetical protein
VKSRWVVEDDGAPSRRRPLHRTRRRITLLVRNSACCQRLSRGGIATWLKSTDFCHPWHNISQQSGGHDVGRADGSGSTKFSKWKNRNGGGDRPNPREAESWRATAGSVSVIPYLRLPATGTPREEQNDREEHKTNSASSILGRGLVRLHRTIQEKQSGQHPTFISPL